MGLCKNCFHREVCVSWTTMNLDDIPPEIPCGHFKDTSDVAPRAEVDEWICRCREWHDIAEKKQKQARQEVAREIFEEIIDYLYGANAVLARDEIEAMAKNEHLNTLVAFECRRMVCVVRKHCETLEKKYTGEKHENQEN